MNGVVTQLQLQRRRTDRVNVFLDDEYAFSLALDLAAGLSRGQVLSDGDVEGLRAEDAYRVALDRALGYLASRPRSRAEIDGYLREREVDEPARGRVLERLETLALVDDHAFAAWWVANRGAHRPRGRLALRSELAARGLSRDAIEAAVAEVDDEDAAVALALSRAERYRGLDRAGLEHRLGGYLRRRGFDYATVRRALDAAWSRLEGGDET